MIDTKLIKQWSEERNAMVETLDIDEFKKFVKKWQEKGIYDSDIKFPSEETIELTLCGMAWQSDDVSEETKNKAVEWCYENGHGLFAEREFIDNDREY